MSHVLSLVLTAMSRSRVHFPDAFLEAWAGLGVVAQSDGVPCFIEDLVDIGRVHQPATATLRNTRLVATGGLGQVKQWATAHQVAHAADGVDGAPTPPSPEPFWTIPPGRGAGSMIPFDTDPPLF